MNKEVKILDYQIYTSIGSIISIIISISLIYNQKLDLLNKETLFSSKNTKKITLYNRIFILILTLIFLYLNYQSREIAKDNQTELEQINLQIIASYFTVIASIIAVYVVSQNLPYDIADIENPII